MSTGEKFFHFAEFLTDRLNPILVKETRQALKSRQFIITFMLLLTIAWLISVGGAMWFGTALEYGSAGRAFFVAYFYVMGFATLFVVPFGAFRSMLNERDHNTYELLSISTLSPRQIVSGKLCSAVVQIFIYYSAIAPFIAFTSLLQGFDLAMVVFFLAAALAWAVFVSMIALMLSTLSTQRQWQAMNTIGMIALLLRQLSMAIGLSATTLGQQIPFDDEEFWWFIVCTFLGAGSYFLLAQQIAVSRLTFESDNRSSGIRVICTLQFWLLWAGVLVYGMWYGASSIDDEGIVVLASMSAIHWLVAGLFAATETDYLSRRVRRGLPRSGLFRLLVTPWMPGGRRGLLLLTVHLAALVVIGRLEFWQDWVRDTVTAIALYVFCYVGFGAAVGRWGQAVTPEFRPAHARVLSLLMAALAMIAPYLPMFFGLVRPQIGYSLTEITNPFRTLVVIADTPHFAAGARGDMADVILRILSAVAGLALLVNLRALLQGVVELARYTPPAVKTSPTADIPQSETAPLAEGGSGV